MDSTEIWEGLGCSEEKQAGIKKSEEPLEKYSKWYQQVEKTIEKHNESIKRLKMIRKSVKARIRKLQGGDARYGLVEI